MMRRSDFIERVAGRIAAIWPHSPLPDETLAAMWETLKDLDADPCVAALESFNREGREFAPTGGMLRKRVVELGSDLPDFAVVLKELNACLAYGERVRREGKWINRRAERLDRAHPSIQAFVEHVGWAAITDFDSEDTTAEAQMRGKWRAFTSRAVKEGTLLGLPSAGLAQLERVNSSPLALERGS